MLHAALAHVRFRGDARALAKALLDLSDCPDLVEDSGHSYGTELTAAQKKDLIAFLKTLELLWSTGTRLLNKSHLPCPECPERIDTLPKPIF